MVEAIHSGGQTGADQGGLAAAVLLGLRTGGWVPRGWRTEKGAAPWLGSDLGLREHSSRKYPPRTELNVKETDGTLIFGDYRSPGTGLTLRLARKHNKPCFIVEWPPFDEEDIHMFRAWLGKHGIRVLNVAGRRESSVPGISRATRDFLVEALG